MPRGEGDRSARPARRRRRGARTGPGESGLTVWGAPPPGTAGLPGAEAGSSLLLGPAPVPKHVTVLSAGPPRSHTDAVAGRRQPPSGKGTEHEQLWPLVLHPLLSRGSGRAPQASGEGSSRAFLVPQRVFLTEVRGGPPPHLGGCLSPEPGSRTGRRSGGRDPASGTTQGLGRPPCLHLGVRGEQAGAETAEERWPPPPPPARLPPEAGRTPGACARALVVPRPCTQALSPALYCTGL